MNVRMAVTARNSNRPEHAEGERRGDRILDVNQSLRTTRQDVTQVWEKKTKELKKIGGVGIINSPD